MTHQSATNYQDQLQSVTTKKLIQRLFAHLRHAVEHDCTTTACVLSNDTDIIVLALPHFHTLKPQGVRKLWVSFGNGENRRWFPIHNLATITGEDKCKGHPFSMPFQDVTQFLLCEERGKRFGTLYPVQQSFLI